MIKRTVLALFAGALMLASANAYAQSAMPLAKAVVTDDVA